MSFVNNKQYYHCSVLLHEAINSLVWRANGIYVDGTFGFGGHSKEILVRLNVDGQLIACDKDPIAIEIAHNSINDVRFKIQNSSFAKIQNFIKDIRISGILLDLGVSSMQLDDPNRGFSFRFNGPLDMRMNNTYGESAEVWLAHVSQNELTEVLKKYGEEKFATKIAKAIIKYRENYGYLKTTIELTNIIRSVIRHYKCFFSSATRTFQAIRIHINKELEDLHSILNVSLQLLELGGRLVVISFHSLEDRIVKQFMRKHALPQLYINKYLPLKAAEMPKPKLRLLGRMRASDKEISMNARARSAILRVAEKI